MKTFKQAIPHFCLEGRGWAKRQPNLATAWRRCRVGGFMAWWLFEFRGVPMVDLWPFRDEAGKPLTFSRRNGDEGKQRRYADLLRANFTMSGKRKAVTRAR